MRIPCRTTTKNCRVGTQTNQTHRKLKQETRNRHAQLQGSCELLLLLLAVAVVVVKLLLLLSLPLPLSASGNWSAIAPRSGARKTHKDTDNFLYQW
jgi:hypothetical protein